MNKSGGKLQKSLKTAGYAHSEIDMILLTHIHTDHSGSLIVGGQQFARAQTSRRLVAAAHLPFPGVGHIRAEGQGYTWVPLDYRWRENS